MKVTVKDGNINAALRKFKKKVEESGVLVEVLERKIIGVMKKHSSSLLVFA